MFVKPKKFRWRKLLSFATDIINKTPSRHDNLLTKIIKSLAIVDSFNTQMTKGGKSTALSSFFGDLDLEEMTNDQFVNMFYSTGLRDSFNITKIEIGDYVEIVKAHRPDIGTLYFVEWHSLTAFTPDVLKNCAPFEVTLLSPSTELLCRT